MKHPDGRMSFWTRRVAGVATGNKEIAMPLEISEDIVSLASQSLGYFVIEGRKIGQKEIDLLAIRLDIKGRIKERLHIETQISTNPAGVLRGEAQLGRTPRDPVECVLAYAKKKFLDPRIISAAQTALGSEHYQRVLVHGRLKEPAQRAFLEQHSIHCMSIHSLVAEALEKGQPNRLKRAVEIAALLCQGE
jgi:hypothetical protein